MKSWINLNKFIQEDKNFYMMYKKYTFECVENGNNKKQ